MINHPVYYFVLTLTLTRQTDVPLSAGTVHVLPREQKTDKATPNLRIPYSDLVRNLKNFPMASFVSEIEKRRLGDGVSR